MNILKAKEHTKDIFRNMKKTADAWRLIAFGLLAANIALAAGFAAVASQNRVVPYIVQVDEHGYEIAVKPAEVLPQIDERIIIARVGTFVGKAAHGSIRLRRAEELYALGLRLHPGGLAGARRDERVL